MGYPRRKDNSASAERCISEESSSHGGSEI